MRQSVTGILVAILGLPFAGPARAQAQTDRPLLAGEVASIGTRTFDAGGLTVRGELYRLAVPENRADPDTKLITLTFGRLRSPTPSGAAPLVYLAGGPGSGATGIADDPDELASWRPVLETCDLILIDQRGTGRSRPLLRHSPGLAIPPDIFVDEASARRYVTAASRATAEHFRAQGVDLAGYSTEQNADDIEALRRGLNLDKISLLGFSYGTHLGLSAVRRHGEHLENVILVGTEGPHETFKLPSNADTQLRKLALLVAADPRVGPAVPDLVALLERVLDKLERDPIAVDVTLPGGERREMLVGKFGLQLILRFDLGDGSDLVVFPKLLHSIDQGDPSVLQWFLQKRLGLFDPINAMFFVMDGSSGAPPGRWEQIRAEAETCLLGDTMNFPWPEVSEAWGTPELGDAFRAPIVSSVRTLFISGTLDWNTPPQQAETMRFGFTNATHLVVEGAGHEQILPQPEIAAAIVAFLRGEDVSGTRVKLPPLRFVPLEGAADPGAAHPSVRE